jgi:hypothetical protein
MWPFTKKTNNVVTIYLTPQQLSCCHMKQSSPGTTETRVHSYLNIPLTHLEFEHALLFNPTLLKQYITNFIATTGLKRPSVALALSGPHILEKIVHTHEAVASPEAFNIPDLASLSWDASYLCPSQQGGFDFFVCGIQPEHLFSYQLFTQGTHLTITTLSTGQHALLQLYKHLHGSTFRQSQLSLDLKKHQYNPSALVDTATILRNLTIRPELHLDVTNESHMLGTHLGLFLSEGKRHE